MLLSNFYFIHFTRFIRPYRSDKTFLASETISQLSHLSIRVLVVYMDNFNDHKLVQNSYWEEKEEEEEEGKKTERL